MDQITLDRIALLHPKLRDEALAIYKEICAELKGKAMCRFAWTFRSFAEQQKLFNQGRNGVPGSIVTKAQAGDSYHNYGLAIDIVLIKDTDGNGSYETASWETKADFDNDKVADWMEVVHIFKKYGWEWGGDWKFLDLPHFQKTFGKTCMQLKAIRRTQGGIDYPNF